MKRKYVFLGSILLVLIMTLFASSCTTSAKEECPVEVISKDLSTNVTLTAVVDSVTIHGVQINRGNFPSTIIPFVNKVANFPVTLNFGDTLIVGTLFSTGRVKEVLVETDKGDWNFTF